MPQMSPMLWMYLFIYFFMLLIFMVVILNFFFYMSINLKNSKKDFLNFKFLW